MNRTRWIWVLGVAVLLLFNGMIIAEEHKRAGLESVYLELQPIDPRSMMQGDYMRLSYSITDRIDDALGSAPSGERAEGKAVLRIDSNTVAHFERLYAGGELADDERLVQWTRTNRVELGVDSFMFQEGHAEAYEDAAYAEVKFTADGAMMLVDLADEDLEPITPTETHSTK